MFIASRYFATVLLATEMPSSLSKFVILLSLSGFAEFSDPINLRIFARTEVEDWSSPLADDRWLEKKYLNSNTPRGVCMYLLVVTREIVDSCIPISSAMSRKTIGFIASSPCSRKWVCRVTILVATFNSVSLRISRPALYALILLVLYGWLMT